MSVYVNLHNEVIFDVSFNIKCLDSITHSRRVRHYISYNIPISFEYSEFCKTSNHPKQWWVEIKTWLCSGWHSITYGKFYHCSITFTNRNFLLFVEKICEDNSIEDLGSKYKQSQLINRKPSPFISKRLVIWNINQELSKKLYFQIPPFLNYFSSMLLYFFLY